MDQLDQADWLTIAMICFFIAAAIFATPTKPSKADEA